MTIAQMLVKMGVDASGVERGLETGVRAFSSFQERIQRAFGRTELISTAAVRRQGQAAVEALTSSLETTYQREIASLRDQVSKGLINPSQYATAGQRAAKAFNQGLSGGVKALTSAGDVTPDLAQTVVAFKENGNKAARAFRVEAEQIVVDAKRIATMAADALEQTAARVNLAPASASLQEILRDVTLAQRAFAEGRLSAQGFADALGVAKEQAHALSRSGSQVEMAFEGIAEAERALAEAATGLQLPKGVADLSSMIADIERAQADFKAGTLDADGFGQAIRFAKEQAEQLARTGGDASQVFAKVAAAEGALQKTNAQLERTTTATRGSIRGLGTLRSTMGALAVDATGVHGPLGRVANALLFIGGGTGVAIGAAVVLGAVGKAIDIVGRRSREAKDKVEKLRKELDALVEKYRDPIELAVGLEKDARADFERVTASIFTLQPKLEEARKAMERGETEAVNTFFQLQSQLLPLYQQQTDANARLAAAIRNRGDTSSEAGKSEIDALARAISLGLATEDQVALARAEVIRLGAAFRSASTDAERLQFGEQLATLRAALEDYRKTAEDAAKAPFEALERVVNATVTRVDVLAERAGNATGTSAAFVDALSDARILLADIERRIAAAGGDSEAGTGLLDFANRLRESIARAPDPFAPLLAEGRTAADNLSRILSEGIEGPLRTRAIERVRAAIATIGTQVGLSGGFGNAPLPAVRMNVELVGAMIDPDPFGPLLTKAEAAAGRLEAVLAGGAGMGVRNQAVADVEAQIGALNAEVERLGGVGRAPLVLVASLNRLKTLVLPLDKTARALGAISASARGVGDVAAALGIASEQSDRLLGGIDGIVQGLQEVRAAKDAMGNFDELAALPGIFGGISAGLSIMGGLFGPSPEAAALRQSLDEAAVAVRSLENEIGNIDINVSGTGFGNVQDAIAKALEQGFAETMVSDEAWDTFFRDLGTSLEEVEAVAEGLNIPFIRTREGFELLAQAMDAAEITSFADSFAGQMERIQRGFEILDITDPAEQLQALLEGALADVDVGSPAIAEAMRGLDLSTVEGLEAFRERLRDLFLNFENLTKEQLGGLEPAEFLDALAQAAGLTTEALEQLLGTTDELNQSMLNVPERFNLAAARFAAEAAANALPQMDPAPLERPDVTLPRLIETFNRMSEEMALANLKADAPPREMLLKLDRIASETPPDLLAAINRLAGVTPAGAPKPAGTGGRKVENHYHLAERAVVIEVASGSVGDPEELLDGFIEGLRRRKRAQSSGDTLDLGDID